MSFSEKLKKMRKDKGLTQEELASKIYVSRTLISKYESGSIYPTKENLEKLALFFDVGVSELMDEEDTTRIVLLMHSTQEKINLIASIIAIIIMLTYLVLCWIPIIGVGKTFYESGSQTPTVLYRYISVIGGVSSPVNPLAIITVITCIADIVLLLLGTILTGRKVVWIRLTAYILFVLNLFLIFFAFVFAFASIKQLDW